MMSPLVLLDFDGVLCDSAREAYTVAQRVAQSDDSLRDDVSFAEFLSFRSRVTDAWQYRRLYTTGRMRPGSSASEPDRSYALAFFEARNELIASDSWPETMEPYSVYCHIRTCTLQNPDAVKIISTRDAGSIRRTFDYFGFGGVEIRGQADVRRFGSKSAVAGESGWLGTSRPTIYVDDMVEHLAGFADADPQIELVHAGWGYGGTTDASWTQDDLVRRLAELFTL